MNGKRYLGALLVAIMILPFFGGCCATRKVTTQTDTFLLRDTTTMEIHFQIDSIHIKDSTFVREKNDTVYVYKERIEYRYHGKTDTCWYAMKELGTVSVVKHIETEPSLWDKLRMQSFWWLIGAIGILAALLVLLIKFKR